MSDRKDYYEVLGVGRDADVGRPQARLSQAGDGAAPRPQPGDKEAETKFKEASEAYQVLSDPEKRGFYDRFGHAGPAAAVPGGGFHDVGDIFSAFGDIFGDMFGGGAGARGAGAPTSRPASMLTLQEASTGVKKELKVAAGARPAPPAAGAGAAPGTHARALPALRRARSGDAPAGLPDDLDHLPALPGRGAHRRKPCARPATARGIDPDRGDPPDQHSRRRRGRLDPAHRRARRGARRAAAARESVRGPARRSPIQRFERDGADLHTAGRVSFPQLALGDSACGAESLEATRKAGDARRGAARRHPGAARARDCRACKAGAGATSSFTSSWSSRPVTVAGAGGAPAGLRRRGRRARPPEKRGGFFRRKKKK